jgi:hypothetical protein
VALCPALVAVAQVAVTPDITKKCYGWALNRLLGCCCLVPL